MKGNTKLIEELNSLLSEELTAINQYIVHAEMAENWGYVRLHKLARGRAVQEMKHAEKLITRILFLEGQPIVSKLNKISIGSDVPGQLHNDVSLEYGAITHYNAVVKLAVEVGDNTTKDLLESILKDEDRHVDEVEENLDQIKQMGLQAYLGQQIRE